MKKKRCGKIITVAGEEWFKRNFSKSANTMQSGNAKTTGIVYVYESV